MPDTDKATEIELQRLRRLPENRVCPNCLREDRIGFKGVCMAYKTFVCHECKSAHQSFSHRTKSVDMSVWTMDEVKTLDERNGGGNRAAQRRWLARMPERERPGPESGLDAHKKFVERAYIEGRWAAPEGAGDAAASHAPGEAASEGERRRHRKHKKDRGERRSGGGAAAPAGWGDPSPGGGADAPGGFADVSWGALGGDAFGMGAASSAFASQPGSFSGATTSEACTSQAWSPTASSGPTAPSAAAAPPPAPPPAAHAAAHYAGGGAAGAGDVARGGGAAQPLDLTNPWMPPIDPGNPWAEVLLGHRLAQLRRA